MPLLTRALQEWACRRASPHTGDMFLLTVQIPLHFPFLEESKIKRLQIMHEVDNPQADYRYLPLQKLDGNGPGGEQMAPPASCGSGFAL